MTTKLALFSVSVLLLILTVACGGKSLDASESQRIDTVAVEDNKFSPRVIEVAPGTTVTWRFETDNNRPHNVTGEGWASDTVTSGAFEHRFDPEGTYDYKCTLHNGMTGRVVVTQ